MNKNKKLIKGVKSNNYKAVARSLCPSFFNLIKGSDVNIRDKDGASNNNSKPSLSESLQAGMEFLNSDSFKQEIERAKKAGDEAERNAYVQQGCPGLGTVYRCSICNNSTYGEETILTKIREAQLQGNFSRAIMTEQQSAYRCRSCGKIYCKDCLEKKAPGNLSGGKSCPGCYGLFEIAHG